MAKDEQTSTGKKDGFVWGTGRRKSSVARVRLLEGDGDVTVNKGKLNDFFHREVDRAAVLAPLKVINAVGKFKVFANVSGGGTSGQAGAISLGIARALVKTDESNMDVLREYGLLTRDSRMKERKKYGRKGARKSFQWTKR
ncbi:MAG: 30S ribosomal protein S9 [Planctomycetes bacterium]|nr:30S ribosomal protein S9 [Planctomycetota bacterium]